MFKKSLLSLAVASSLALTGCLDSGSSNKNARPAPEYSNTPTEGRTWPVFDPVEKAFPVPNDLMMEQASEGKPADGTLVPHDQLAGLDYLDGASTTSAIDIPMSGPLSDAAGNLDARAFIESPDP